MCGVLSKTMSNCIQWVGMVRVENPLSYSVSSIVERYMDLDNLGLPRVMFYTNK